MSSSEKDGPSTSRKQSSASFSSALSTLDTSDEQDKETLEEGSKSILLGLISQLSKGMDLSKVTLPTFVLEPRSLLERITDFMSHPNFVLDMSDEADPLKRFLGVVQYFISGWHIRPKGVKKPYNPVLGEYFRCKYDFPDGSQSFYVAEQVSHHPPISAYYYVNAKRKVIITGDLRPKSKFLGNSAATIMQGSSLVYFTNRPYEVYTITMPNIYARGILFGTMFMEVGDEASVKCPLTGFVCELEFKTKGFFGGTYNAITGRIKNAAGDILYTISGKWSDVVYIQKKNSKDKQVFFNARTEPVQTKIVNPLEKQTNMESRKLWNKVTLGILGKDMDAATKEKTIIEENQRESLRSRASYAEGRSSHYFRVLNHATDPNLDTYDFKKFSTTDLNEKEIESAIFEEIH